jgi:tripeptidyl-peptidase-1
VESSQDDTGSDIDKVQPSDVDGHIHPPNIPGIITPALINEIYDIRSNIGIPAATQAVYETENQTFSPSDLSIFFKRFKIPNQHISSDIGGHMWKKACKVDNGDICGEANLDVQYLMSTCQECPTTYWFVDTDEHYCWDFMIPWAVQVANMTHPPLVHSVSYGGPEAFTSHKLVRAFNLEAQKLGLQGVSIIVASGDDGVSGPMAREDGTNACGYSPLFPASSPYVTTVGGTQVATTLLSILHTCYCIQLSAFPTFFEHSIA